MQTAIRAIPKAEIRLDRRFRRDPAAGNLLRVRIHFIAPFALQLLHLWTRRRLFLAKVTDPSRVGNANCGGEQQALSLEPPDGRGIDADRANSARFARREAAVSLRGAGLGGHGGMAGSGAVMAMPAGIADTRNAVATPASAA